MLPTKMFLTRGVGRHKEKLASFEDALRDAGLAEYNLVNVSSIYPPGCKLIRREEGKKLLSPGQIVYCVMGTCPNMQVLEKKRKRQVNTQRTWPPLC